MSAASLSFIPTITKLSTRITRVLGCNPGPMTLQGTNTYLIGSGKKRILLDTGDTDKKQYTDNLKKILTEENATVDTILITHWHHDHIGGVKDVLKDNNIKDSLVWKYPRTDSADIYEDFPKTVKLNYLSDGQEFNVEGASLKVIHTPGHTTDHVIVMLKEEKAVFSGDCILGEGTAVFEDLYDYMNSLNIILKLNPSTIYPGHGNIIKEPKEKILYYINHRNLRENQIIDLLRLSPKVAFNELDIVKEIYKETPEELWPAAAFNVNHHLKKLTKEGKIVEIKNKDSSVWKYSNNLSTL